MIRSYRYRLYPTAKQAAVLNAQLSACCDLYNAALEQRVRAWKEHGVSVGRYAQHRELTEVRAVGLMPEGMSVMAQRSALDRLDRAFRAFYRRVEAGDAPGFPRYRSTRRYGSMSWPNEQGAVVRAGKLCVTGVGALRVRWHRPIPVRAELRTATIKRQNGRWYVILALRIEDSEALVPSGHAVGVDRGVTVPYALSTGEHVEGPRARRHGAGKLRRARRRVARRKVGSARQAKAKLLVARHSEREANRRRDFLHKLSTRLVAENDLIAFEDLSVSRMARGNRGLNREILDQGWAELVRMTTYKAESAGRLVVKVPAPYTSQTCHGCGTVDASSRRGTVFRCVACGREAHADTNAALNILGAGLALQALMMGEEVRVA